MIDTHCHLNFKTFKGKVEDIIAEAKKAGVEKVIVPGTDLESSKKARELAQKYAGIYAAVGVHPHHSKIKNERLKIKDELLKLAQNKKVVAIGECGLDYYQYQKTKYKNYIIDEDFKKRQKEIFELQIKLASELNLALIIHNRQASKDILRLLTTYHSLLTKLVFHCFEGDEEILKFSLEQNFYLGITGNVTYNKKVEKAVKRIPLKNLLLETDAPFLTPEPLKSRNLFPNTPKNVRIIASKIAEIKGEPFSKVAKKTGDNAYKLFKI